MRQDGTTKVLWFLAGLAVGTAAGMLTAPRSGSATRHALAESGREYFDRGVELYEKGKQLADEAAEMYDEGRKLVEDARVSPAEA